MTSAHSQSRKICALRVKQFVTENLRYSLVAGLNLCLFLNNCDRRRFII